MLMDHFYNKVYAQIIYRYVILDENKYLTNNFSFCTSSNNAGRNMIWIEGGKARGKITIWDNGFLEYIICDNTGNTLFYLHFHVIGLNQFEEAYKVFYHSLKLYSGLVPYRIALCCTTGLSANIFLEKIQRIMEKERIDITIDATSYHDICNDINKYDRVFMLPGSCQKQIENTQLIEKHHYNESGHHSFVKEIIKHIEKASV